MGIVDHDARELWRDIVEGRSTLWDGIPLDRKETIRGALSGSILAICVQCMLQDFSCTLRTKC